MATPEVALRKRQQIAKANRTMFVWIAAVSAIVGFSVVVAVMLWQQQSYNGRVLSEKSKTDKTLAKNIESITLLEEEIRVLNTNQALRESMTDGGDQPLQVVLDALPSEPNSSALGSSLQERFLKKSGLTIESLTVDPIQGVESQVEAESVQDASSTDSAGGGVTLAQPISFVFGVSVASSRVDALQDLLQRLERSIRPINVTDIKLEHQGSRTLMTVSGHSYYEPAVTADLKSKKVEVK